jgi:hypothetical protein
MTNHLLAVHPVSGGDGGGGSGGSKSNAAIPVLDEECSLMQYAAWVACFERWQLACKITDKQVENRILEAIPNSVADQIVVSLVGNEDKAALMERIKGVMVKKRSTFLYRSDFHKLTQNRGELPERFAARIRQSAPPCQFVTDSGTAEYGPDLMSSVFILGLADSYTCEKLFALQPVEGKTTVQFDVLIAEASVIQQAKDNCQDAVGASMSEFRGQESGGKKTLKCFHCNKTTHSDKGFTREIREQFCKAAKHKCKICEKVGHFPDCCRKGKAPFKKAKVNALTAEGPGGEAAVVTQLAEAAAEPGAQAAALNSIEQVRPYQFNPERYQSEDCGWWSLEALSPKPIQTRRVWARMEAMSSGLALGHYLFDNVKEV